MKLMEDKNPNFMCNRTINSKIIYQINQACHNGYKMLLENDTMCSVNNTNLHIMNKFTLNDKIHQELQNE